MTLLIVTPIQPEYDALARSLGKQDPNGSDEPIGRLTGRRYPRLGVVLAVGGLGKAQYGVQVQHLIDACPGLSGVVCAGTGGALSKDLRPGDVVVATETVEHDCIYKFAPKGPPRFAGDRHLLDRVRRGSANGELGFQVHFGPVASGDEDVVDRKRAEAIRARTGALAVAWEGAGGARASKFSGVPYLEVRGVSDGSDPLALISFVLNLGRVMDRIGHVLRPLYKFDNAA